MPPWPNPPCYSIAECTPCLGNSRLYAPISNRPLLKVLIWLFICKLHYQFNWFTSMGFEMKDAFQFTKFKNCMCLVVVLGACVSMSACQSLGTPVIQLDIDMDVQSSDVPSQKSDVTYVASAPLFPFRVASLLG